MNTKQIENWIRDYEEEIDTIIFETNGLMEDFSEALSKKLNKELHHIFEKPKPVLREEGE